jgi:pimeloyl-ACP methyl ester carboxylesterase
MAGRLCVVVLLAVLAAACGGDEPEPQRPRPAPEITGAGVTGSGELVDVGGRRLYVECIGSGTPTVVLEAGFGGRSANWSAVMPAIGRTTRVCAYDRAGAGSSVAMPGVHDAGDEIRDLERLLDRARIEPPYVLVGHSYGGLLTRLFARAHRGETAGIVLVDSMGIDTTRRQLAVWPKSMARDLRREWATPVVDGVDLRAGEALDRSIRSLGDTPLVVITAARHEEGLPPLPSLLRRRLESKWRQLQVELAALSTDHAHVVGLRSDHFVQRADQQPLVIVRAVDAVVRAHRDDAALPPCARLFGGAGVHCLS